VSGRGYGVSCCGYPRRIRRSSSQARAGDQQRKFKPSGGTVDASAPINNQQHQPRQRPDESAAPSRRVRLPDSRSRGSLRDRYGGARDFRSRTQAATPSAGGDTRANTNTGVGPAFTRDMLVANLGASCLVAGPAAASGRLRVALSHERGCGRGADDAGGKALADRLIRAGQQAPRRCRSRGRAGARPSAGISSQLDETGEPEGAGARALRLSQWPGRAPARSSAPSLARPALTDAAPE
jgi:hypothetical protein